jgi:hypothetical protein
MQTQTKLVGMEGLDLAGTVKLPEVLPDHSEIARIELLATLTDKTFQDALTVLNTEMMESGKANAIAIYKKPWGIEFSKPKLGKKDQRYRFGEDPRQCVWHEEVEVDDLLDTYATKNQQLLWEQDEKTGLLLPRSDLMAYMTGFPMGNLDGQGLTAEDVRRPTKPWLKLFALHAQSNPGFTGMILTNDGKDSGLLLFKIQEGKDKEGKDKKLDPKFFNGIGIGDKIGREESFAFMGMAKMTHADIDLGKPKIREKKREKESYEQYQQRIATKYEQEYERRVEKAVNVIFSTGPDEYVN